MELRLFFSYFNNMTANIFIWHGALNALTADLYRLYLCGNDNKIY